MIKNERLSVTLRGKSVEYTQAREFMLT